MMYLMCNGTEWSQVLIGEFCVLRVLIQPRIGAVQLIKEGLILDMDFIRADTNDWSFDREVSVL